jgi:hypothetical protein
MGNVFTATEKLDCINREIKMRRRVYPRWVAEGRMTQEKANSEIACMEAIAQDYEKQAQGERLL